MLSLSPFLLLDPNQGIETYKHFWLETIRLIHLALLHLALSATPNVITPNVINIVYYIWRCITLEVITKPVPRNHRFSSLGKSRDAKW